MSYPACVAVALVVLLPGAVSAQPAPHPDQAAILAVIDNFMHAVSRGDDALMATIRRAGTSTTVERPAETGGMAIVRRDFTPAAATAAPRTGTVRERYWDPVVLVRGSLAVVWTPYEFWRDDRTTHCGIDVFELVREEGAWRIGHVMYTVEPDACPALRPADPSRVRPAP